MSAELKVDTMAMTTPEQIKKLLAGGEGFGFTGNASEIDEVAENLPKLPKGLAERLPNEVAEKLTPAEEAFLNDLLPSFDEREWITNAEVREATGKSEG